MLTKGNTINMSKFLISAILKPFNINNDRLNFTSKSDVIGAFASGLCMMHCIATPFFFIASACSATCCNTSPIWWQRLDYIFLFVSCIATSRVKSSFSCFLGCSEKPSISFFRSMRQCIYKKNENMLYHRYTHIVS